MTATILTFPESGDRAWQAIGNPLRANILERTGSAEITDAVEARCRDVFERCFPGPKLISAGATHEEISDVINTIIGRFLSELCQVAVELELLKQEEGYSGNK